MYVCACLPGRERDSGREIGRESEAARRKETGRRREAQIKCYSILIFKLNKRRVSEHVIEDPSPASVVNYSKEK